MQEVLLWQMLSNKTMASLSENNMLKNTDNGGEVFDFAKLLFVLTNGAKLDKANPQKIMPKQKQSMELNISLTKNILQSKKNEVVATKDADKIKFLHDYDQAKANISNNQNVKTKDASESTKIVQSSDEQDVVSNSANLQQQQNVNVKEDDEILQTPSDAKVQKFDNAKTTHNAVKENSSSKEIVQNVSADEVKEDLNIDEKIMLAILNQLIAVMEAIKKLLNVGVNNVEVPNTKEENSNLNIVQIVQQLNAITENLETLKNSDSDLKQEAVQMVNDIKEKLLQLKPELALLQPETRNQQPEITKKEIVSSTGLQNEQNADIGKNSSVDLQNEQNANIGKNSSVDLQNEQNANIGKNSSVDLQNEQNADIGKNLSVLKTEILEQPKEIPLVKNHSANENNLLKEIALLLKDLQGVVAEVKTSQVQASNNQVAKQQSTQSNNEILSWLQKVEDKVKNLLSENSVVNEDDFVVESNGVKITEVKVSSLNNKASNELQIKTNALNEENKTVVLNTNPKTDLNNGPLLEQETNDNILQKIVSSVRNFSHEMKSGSGYDMLLREQLVLNFSPNDKQAISLFLQNMQSLMQSGEIKSVVLNNALQSDTQNNNGFDAQTSSGNNLLLGLKEPVNLKTAGTSFENIISTKASSAENIIENIVQGVRLVLSKDYGEMRLKLKPENLGEVTLKVILEEGLVRANIQAQNQQVVSVLEKNISTLEERLKHQGIKLDEIIVQQYANNGSDFNSQQQLAEKNQQHTAQTKSFYFGNANNDEKESASAMSLKAASSYLDKLSNINFLA